MTELSSDNIWRHCNICKAGIGFEAGYFLCSVSTCNRKRTGLTFCSLPCFQAHLPTARHRDAWAEPEKSPSRAEWQALRASEDASVEQGVASPGRSDSRARVSVTTPEAGRAPVAAAARPPHAPDAAASAEEPETSIDVLVVVSKLKKYVRDWSGMNTSDTAIPVLSDHLRELCREAIRQAGLDGRRTVLDRDFTKVLKQRREASREGDFDSRR
jgi:histone H3/H4